MDRNLSVVRDKAKKLNIDASSIKISNNKNKRFQILVNGKTINFGLYPFKNGTYIDHHDDKLRAAYRARHSKILKDGKPAYLNPESPSYYSWNLLW